MVHIVWQLWTREQVIILFPLQLFKSLIYSLKLPKIQLDFLHVLRKNLKLIVMSKLNSIIKIKKYKANFLILPKVLKEKILIGKELIRTITCSARKQFQCEINTTPGKSVVEKVYNLPKMMEEGVEIAINELIDKGYIRRSKSTWLNNIRPVVKPDGSIRVTTNLVNLNKLVELDRCSLPNIDHILYGLCDMAWFSKIGISLYVYVDNILVFGKT